MIRCMFNFLCSKSSNLVTSIFFMKKKIEGVKLEIKIQNYDRPKKQLKSVLALYIMIYAFSLFL